MTAKIKESLNLDLGINANLIHYQWSPEALQKQTILLNMGRETENGTLAVHTGKFTGRSPEDRYIVVDALTRKTVDWGAVNLPFDQKSFDMLYRQVTAYLQDTVYVRDAQVCAGENYKMNIRVITEYPWSNLFAYNMFLRPEAQELDTFKPEWTVINAPGYKATPGEHKTKNTNFTIINFSKRIILIGGTGYTGEIKKGVFSALNFLLPVKEGVFPMHCAANVGKNGETALFFGLSGTGKTTLSADVNRKLIGDDEHGWSKEGVFNFEGGCYAKVIGLSPEKEPEIFDAIKKGALLENVSFMPNGSVDYTDASITQNTRVSYPIHFLRNIQQPSTGTAPKHIFLLTADAFGVLPPIAKLNQDQAAYYFISGYTAKVAGTEKGITEPVPSFSACFGAPFLPLSPVKYTAMLLEKLKQDKVSVWLVNTGWIGGSYGVGERIPLKYTRAMINAVLKGELKMSDQGRYTVHPTFKLAMPKKCGAVPEGILNPVRNWKDKGAYHKTEKKLADAFQRNFEKYKGLVSESIYKSGPFI
ncbi:phosphoenolpyruvate carboxykinase (ATP) [Galbibacter pacificus]|uniref:Phosphoenolpyruvate carboxykinase (ATP) n=1 Tax=Galbibacter pacificus TaxID=2996052 RepID=A0ABT6FSF9_9FLAO|nr:phosphoenolpyruvate carboxykinase (ATP) [Galbibacter pacificus]MDG3582897.1 phosphoenolpyruvate carboxykinase (ATP) [Galbibacter pacificus]MDG3585984.1 phosphoenolpyruvate carboxykinase (ATP) [Galbibacter pacificus]